jgi:hypothetical protein
MHCTLEMKNELVCTRFNRYHKVFLFIANMGMRARETLCFWRLDEQFCYWAWLRDMGQETILVFHF